MYLIIIILELIQFVASSSLISQSFYLDVNNRQSRRYKRRRPQLVKRSSSLFLHRDTDTFSIYLSCNAAESECQLVLDHLARASKRIGNVVVIGNRIRLNATVR
jgi:hypothetical protein